MTFLEQSAEAVPLRRLWILIAPVVLAVVTIVVITARTIATRWRGIVLTHIFFLTLWLAIQAFFFATGSNWCFPSENPKWLEGLFKYFPHISRCLPAVASSGSKPVPLRDAPASSSSPAVQSRGAPASSSPPAVQSHGAITKCWRDRSLSGNCFARAEPHRKLPPHRLRIPAPPPFPCRRYYDCGWDDI